MPLGLVPEMANSSALRYFVEVVRHGSFRAAAGAVKIAPSAIIRQIRLLEDELGVTLLERGRGRAGCRLTPAGDALMYRVGRAMRELTLATQEVNALQSLQAGRLALGVNDTIAREFGVRFLASFCAAHPAITVDITTGNSPQLIDLLVRDQLDLVIGSGIVPGPSIKVLAGRPTQIMVMTRHDHPAVDTPGLNIADIALERLILPSAGIALRDIVDRMLAELGRTPKTILSTNSFELMADMVAAGMGVGIQARPSRLPDPSRPAIRYVPLVGAPARTAVLACCIRVGRTPSAALTECLREIANALSSWFDAAGWTERLAPGPRLRSAP